MTLRLLKRFHSREHPVQAGHADVVDALDAVAHDFGGDGGFLGHRQIARAGTDDGDEPGALGQRLFFDGHAAGEAMVDGGLEFFPQGVGMFGSDAGDEHRLAMIQKFGRDFDDLFRRLAGAKNHFGKIFPQRAVRVHLRETEVGHRRGLEGAENLCARDFPGAKLVQQAGGFGSCHRVTMPHELPAVTREFRPSKQLFSCHAEVDRPRI